MANPSSQCMAHVGIGTVTFPCVLDFGHEGPHLAPENAASVRARQRYEATVAHAHSPLAEFQGPAQTTAERFTENPTPVPQSQRILREDAETHPREEPESTSTTDLLARFGTPIFVSEEQDLRVWALKSGDRFMVSDFAGGNVRIVATTDLVTPSVRVHHEEGADPAADEDTDVQSLVIADLTAARDRGEYRYRTPLSTFTQKGAARQVYSAALDLAAGARALVEIASHEASPTLDLALLRDQVRLREILSEAFNSHQGEHIEVSDIVDIVLGVLTGTQGDSRAQ